MGLCMSSRMATREDGAASVISMRPSPTLLLPLQVWAAPLPLSGPLYAILIAGSGSTNGFHVHGLKVGDEREDAFGRRVDARRALDAERVGFGRRIGEQSCHDDHQSDCDIDENVDHGCDSLSSAITP